MPATGNPNQRDFYVYVFIANKTVFYVGVGRDRRADMRLKWVQAQMAKERRGIDGKWARHTSVIATCMRLGIGVKYRKLRTGITKKRALAYERNAIARYLRRGIMLANVQLNPNAKHSSEKAIISALRQQSISG